jgi:SAM-dependent methyltransferase
MAMQEYVFICCPYCASKITREWAAENGFTAVKCASCGLVYVNPRPSTRSIDIAVETGFHQDVPGGAPALARRLPGRITEYERLFAAMYADVWSARRPISWLDVGAGYGEVVEAVARLAAAGSAVEGIEPMRPKALAAQQLGLQVHQGYLRDVKRRFEYVSLVHVFSHIPDFRGFLAEVKLVMTDRGELYIETGNAADLRSASQVPTELDLPDHLVFAGREHLLGYLREAGFEIVQIRELRRDGLLNFCRNVVKRLMGRRVHLRVPYTSGHRAIRVRARRTE